MRAAPSLAPGVLGSALLKEPHDRGRMRESPHDVPSDSSLVALAREVGVTLHRASAPARHRRILHRRMDRQALHGHRRQLRLVRLRFCLLFERGEDARSRACRRNSSRPKARSAMPWCAPWPKARSRAPMRTSAIAVSGIAGPGGAVPGKPVGTVWFALAHRQEDRLECQGHLIQFDGNRDAVRRQAVEYALNLLRALPQPRLNCCGCSSRCSPRPNRTRQLVELVAPLVAQLERAGRARGESACHAVFHRRGARGAARCVARRGSAACVAGR